MATFIKGDPIENATHYELAEKLSDGTYALRDTKAEINFEVSDMNLSAGAHTLVVKAHAAGYESSDYSNEVVYTVEAAPAEPADELAGTWLMNETIDLTNFGGTKGTEMGLSGMNLYKGYDVDYTAGSQSSEYLLTHTSAAGILAYCIPGTSNASFLYNDGKWANGEYRTIAITSKLSEVPNGDKLLAWLNANGTKQS